MKIKLTKILQFGILNSLKVRLIASALLIILIIMPLIGFTLNDAFREQAKRSVENELSAYIYSILAVAELENSKLIMPELLLENQFNVIQSGLYALISMPSVADRSELNLSLTFPNQIVWSSDSFLGLKPPAELFAPNIGLSDFSEIDIEGKLYFIYSFTASFEQTSIQSDNLQQLPITVHIIKHKSDLQQQVDRFSKTLWGWLFLLMLFLVFVQLVWLWWTLKPLAKFTRELFDIEQGKAQQLGEDYPTELQVVAKQLNALLNTEKSQRKRYRNALSDLAHSLKTPLAVIQSQEDLSPASIDQVKVINNIIGHQLKRAQTAAGSSWHLGVNVNSIADKLVRALTKIYGDKAITITADVDKQAIFRGDQSDLNEILGNLLDNACKAARSQVLLTTTALANELIICVEDDGSGVDVKQQAKIFERGIRADSYQQGHGIGLAIVGDLVDSYQGKLRVSTSTALGGAKFTLTFGAILNRKK